MDQGKSVVVESIPMESLLMESLLMESGPMEPVSMVNGMGNAWRL